MLAKHSAGHRICLKAETRDFQFILSALPNGFPLCSKWCQNSVGSCTRCYIVEVVAIFPSFSCLLPTSFVMPQAQWARWPSLCSSHMPRSCLPQSLCTYYSFCLECSDPPSLLLSPPLYHHQVSSLSFRDLSLSIISTKRSFLTALSQVGPHRTQYKI